MEPRWRNTDDTAWKIKGYIFIGGTNRFDLWSEDSENPRYVRLVCGEKAADWDYMKLPLGNPPRSKLTHFGDIELSREEAEEVETYLKLFAPWALGKSLTQKESET